jgi:predicted DsbA family dithiol-disulfide isomerase
MGYSRVGILRFSLLRMILNVNFYSNSVEVKDISLTDYIQVRHAVYLPHTAGRYAKKQFRKAQMPIVERLVDRYITTWNVFKTILLTRSLQA